MNNVSSISEIITEVESKWLKLLFSFNKQLFTSYYLPSHDHTHHLRVWQNAKDLIFCLSNYGVEINYAFVERLIIACMFHDTGLTITLDEKHGAASKRICQDYFSEQNQPLNFNEILNAIEFHEDKKYIKNSTSINSINSILAVSDDIDAFGYIGIYRYTEIYLMRGLGMNEIGSKVLSNLESRFKNIENIYGKIEPFFQQTIKKYEITQLFFNNLIDNNQDHNTIFKIIQEEIIMNKKLPVEVYEYLAKISNNRIVKEFSTSILNEYYQFNYSGLLNNKI